MTTNNLKFDQAGLIPAIVQDFNTGEVLTLAYMSAESLEKTLESGETWFWSRSRQKLWHKGETSGHIQKVKQVYFDCDSDALLVKVEPRGIACHTGERSCFHRLLQGEAGATPQQASDTVKELAELIAQRKASLPQGSYTSSLFLEGLPKISAKVEEESGEVILAAREESDERVVSEAADLMYHLIVLLAYRDIAWEDVLKELEKRRR